MNRVLPLVVALVAVPVMAGSPPETLPADAIPNYRLVNPGLATAGQPSPETLAKLKELGFKTVVNLRPVGEAEVVAKEKGVIESQGLRYVSVPFTAATFSADDVEAVRSVLDDEGSAPVLLHCASANRVGAVWGILKRRQGLSLADAEAEARKVGLSSPTMIEAFHKVAGAIPPTEEKKP
jgi:uncharacterized protein (TIGR01244 family)